MPDLTLVANKTAAAAARDDSFDTPELWKHVQAAHTPEGKAALLAHLDALRAADKHALWCAEVNLDGAGEHIAELQQDVARARHQALEDAARAAEAHSLAEQLTRMTMANPLSHSLNLVGVVAKAIRALQEVAPAAPEPSGMALEAARKMQEARAALADMHGALDSYQSACDTAGGDTDGTWQHLRQAAERAHAWLLGDVQASLAREKLLACEARK